jgi:hypothetical protein
MLHVTIIDPGSDPGFLPGGKIKAGQGRDKKDLQGK